MYKLKCFLVLLLPILGYSQLKIDIPLGDSVAFHQPLDHYEFSIENSNYYYSFQDFRRKKFDTPALYKIKTRHKEHNHSMQSRCYHPEGEEIIVPETFFVNVDSVRIDFNPHSLKLAKPIYKNQSTEGNYLTVEAHIYNYYKTPIAMNLSPVKTAGIGANIQAALDSSMTILANGTYILKYNLTGLCTEASYIQFDFIDHTGAIVPIGLTTPIKE